MKNTKVLSILLAIVILLPFGILSGNAVEDADADSGYDLTVYAADIQEAYSEELATGQENALNTDPDSQEYLTRNYAASVFYNTILEYVESNTDELREHFSGAYDNDDGDLVVLLSCPSDRCRNFILKDLACENVLFEEGNGSYYHTKEKLDTINAGIGNLQDRVRNGMDTDVDTVALMSAYPRTVYDDLNNTISVEFYVSPTMEQAVEKANAAADPQMAKSNTFFTEEEANALDIYEDYIQCLESKVEGLEDVQYTVNSDTPPIIEEEAIEWRPGRSLFVLDHVLSDGTAKGSLCSTGYRAMYRRNERTYYGFVTCGHGTAIGKSVYAISDDLSLSEGNRIGIILDRKYGDTVGASFVNIITTKYTNSNTVYYSSSKPEIATPGIILDGTQASIRKNTKIYKAGRTTYLTGGRVFQTSMSGYYNEIYFTDMIQADVAMTMSGDSGGVTYICDGTTSYGKAVGIVKGKHDGLSVFIKASNISNNFGPFTY